jgi:hypothetical protein
MKIITDTNQFRGGWYIGSWPETAYTTNCCEVSYKTHNAGEYWQSHYHQFSDEINYLISGKMSINGTKLEAPCIFVIYKGEISEPIFETDVCLIVVKIPNIRNDKIVI